MFVAALVGVGLEAELFAVDSELCEFNADEVFWRNFLLMLAELNRLIGGGAAVGVDWTEEGVVTESLTNACVSSETGRCSSRC